MSTCVYARVCADDDEKAKLRKLSTARHAPADWIMPASIVTMSQSAMTVPQIAAEMGWDSRRLRCAAIKG